MQSSATQERLAIAVCNEILCDPSDSSVKSLVKVVNACNLAEAGPVRRLMLMIVPRGFESCTKRRYLKLKKLHAAVDACKP
jgi:hypothetical protein